MGNGDTSETIILIFFIGIASMGVMGFPSFMMHMQSMTPEAYAEEQKFNVLSSYYYQPILASSYLVMPIADVLPPPDPNLLFETMYAQPIQIEFGVLENGIQEFLMPLEWGLSPITNNIFNDFEILPSAFATNSPPFTLPAPDFFDDFTTDKGWSSNDTSVIDVFTATGTINVTTLDTSTSSTKISLNIDDLLVGGWDETKWSLRAKVQMNSTTSQRPFTLLGVSEVNQQNMSGSTLDFNCSQNIGPTAIERDLGCLTFIGAINFWQWQSKNNTDASNGFGNTNVNLTESYTLDSFIYPEIIVDGNYIRVTVYSDANYQHVKGCTNDKFDSSTGNCDFEGLSSNWGVTTNPINLDCTSARCTEWNELNYLWFGGSRSTALTVTGTQGSIHEVSFWNGANVTALEQDALAPLVPLPTPDFFDDFTTDQGWVFNGTDAIDIFTPTGTINLTIGATFDERNVGTLDIDSLLSGGWNQEKWTLRGKSQINASATDTGFVLLGVSEDDQAFIASSFNRHFSALGFSPHDSDKAILNMFPSNDDWQAYTYNETAGIAGESNANLNLTTAVIFDKFYYPEIIVDDGFMKFTVYSDANYQRVLGCTNDKFDSSSGNCDFSTSTNKGVSSTAFLIDADTGAVKMNDLKYLYVGSPVSVASDSSGTQGSWHEFAFWNGINATESESIALPNPVTALTSIPVAPYKIDLDWTHDLIDVTGYNIYRGNATVPFELIAETTNATITEFADVNQQNLTKAIVNSFSNAIGLTPNTNYNYTICAVNGGAEESTCATTSATTADDTDVWNLKEHDAETPNGSDIDFTATGGSGDWLSAKSSILSRGGNSAIVWKSFNVTEITGSDFQLYWDGDIVSGVGDDSVLFRICEDIMTPYNQTLWVGDGFPPCTTIATTATIMPTGTGTAFEPVFERWSLDWTQITSDFITVILTQDDDLLATSYDMDYKNFTWTNKTSWDFTGLTINYTNTNDFTDGEDFECNAIRPNFASADMCNSGVFIATSTPNVELKSVEGVNDWQYREYTDLGTGSAIPFFKASIDSSGFKMNTTKAPTPSDPLSRGEMLFFKSFPASSVINKNITISWDGVDGISSGLTTSVEVYNGTIDRWSGSDFLVLSDLDVQRERIDILSLLAESFAFSTVGNSETVANLPSESTVTVVVKINDNSAEDGTLTIQNITIGNTFYSLEGGSIDEEVSGRHGGDRGLVTPLLTIVSSVIVPSAITDLNATQTNSIILNWTAPDDGGSPITGYEIERARSDIARNGTYMDFLFREHELSGKIDLGDLTDEEILSANEGFVGQALNVTSDEEVGAIGVSFHRLTTTSCSGSAFLQGSIFFDNGTRVENSTNTFTVCSITTDTPLIEEDHIFIFDNTEIFSGNEYVFGVEKVGTNTDGIIDVIVGTERTILADGFTSRDLITPPFVFTNDTSTDTAVSVFILNFTTLVTDTGNTNTNFTDTSCPAGITCYYRAQAINVIGTGGKSNIVNATEEFLETIFNATSNVNEFWSYRVHDDDYGIGSPTFDCTFGGSEHCGGIPDTEIGTEAVDGFVQRPHMKLSFGSSAFQPVPEGEGYIFKTFTKDAILNQDITIAWEVNVGGGIDRPMSIQVYDGHYIAENNEDFPYNNAIKLKGGGLLGECLTQTSASTDGDVHLTQCLDGIDGNDRSTAIDVDYSLSTEDYITVFIKESPARISTISLYLNNMTISSIAFWDFLNSDVTNTRGAFNDTRVIEFDEEAGFFSQGIVQALAPIDTPFDLNATATAPDLIELLWTHDLQNVETFDIYRDNVLIASRDNTTLGFVDADQPIFSLTLTNSLENATGLTPLTAFEYHVCAVDISASRCTLINATATTGDDTNVWQLKEHDGDVDTSTAVATFSDGGTTFDLESDVLGDVRNGANMFKVFNITEIFGGGILLEDPFEIQPASNGWTETCVGCTASSGIFFFPPSSAAFRIDSVGAPLATFGLERSLDTTGVSNVAFNLTAHQLGGTYEVADYLEFQVDFGNGSGFLTILKDVRHWSGVDNRITDPDPSGNTVPTSTGFVSMGSDADNNPDLKIRIEGRFNSQTIFPPLEGYFIDHIQVKGSPASLGSDFESFFDLEDLGFGSQSFARLNICEGSYNRFNTTVFENEIDVASCGGNKILYSLVYGSEIDEPVKQHPRLIIDWKKLDGDLITVLFNMRDRSTTTAFNLQITNFTITNQTTWNMGDVQSLNVSTSKTCDLSIGGTNSADNCDLGVVEFGTSSNVELKATRGSNDWEYIAHDHTEGGTFGIEQIFVDSSGVHLETLNPLGSSAISEETEITFFKQFNTTDIDGLNFTVNWSATGGGDLENSMIVLDGVLDRWNFTQFADSTAPANYPNSLDALNLDDADPPFSDRTDTFQMDLSGSTSSLVTSLLEIHDNNNEIGADYEINWIKVGLTNYTFSGGSTQSIEVSNNRNWGDRGLITPSSSVSAPTVFPPEKPINLNSTAVQRDVLLEWTQPAGDDISSSNATDFEIKRDAVTIVPSLASIIQGVFSEDFSYPDNATADIVWTHNGCDTTFSTQGFCGVNSISKKVIINATSRAEDGITYDLLANNGFNVTDASGNGDFTLLFDIDYDGDGSAIGNFFVGIGNDTGLELPTKDTNYLGVRITESIGLGGQTYSVYMSDDQDRSLDGLDLGINIASNGGDKIYFNMTYISSSSTLFTTTYSDAERTNPTGTNPRINVQGSEDYENLRYILLTPFGQGGDTVYDIWNIDNIQLFVNGTTTPITKYIDINPGLNILFSYTIIPSNTAGDGLESDASLVTTNDFPNTPTSESAMALSGSEIEITWISPTDYGVGSPSTGIDPKEIVIFKENTTDATPFSKLVTLPSTQTLFSDSIVDSGKNYTYKIAGQNSIGLGANTTEVLAFASNNTVIFTVLENDLTTTLENLAMVTIDNGVDSETKLTDPAGKVQFFEKTGNFDIIVKETENDFVILKANQTFIGTGTELFNLQTLVFRTNCLVNDPPTDPDVRILVNHTDAHLVTAHSTPVCVENVFTDRHEITWTETFTSDSASGSIFTSKMVADVLRADTFGTGDEVFEISTVDTGISYDSGLKKLSSITFDIGTGLSSPSFAFFLELDATGGGGGNIGGPQPNPITNPPIPGGGGTQSTSSPAPFGEFQLAQLSITSDTLFLIAGERVESDLFIDWNVDDNFIITGVRVDKNARWFAFESTPKPFNSQGAFGTADLGFIIQLDPNYCNPQLGVTVNCVERGVVTIPITVEGIVGGKKVEEQHFLTIDTSERFGLSTFLIIFFVFFLIIALAVASNRASTNNKKKVQQKVKRRVSQKNKKKGSTVQRLKSRR